MSSRAERYLDHLDGIAGVEPDLYQVNSVTALVYHDLPEPGHLIGLTYGLSTGEHPDWRHGKPELCISVQSEDVAWALAGAHLAESLRGECPFEYGDTIDFGGPVSDESEMTAFMVFAPLVLEREDYLDIHLGGAPEANGDADPDDIVNIAGLYPIHDVELKYIQDEGLGAFWQLDWDPYDVTRPPVVS